MPRVKRESSSAEQGPSLRAVSFFGQPGDGAVSLLSRRQRQHIMDISTRVRVPPRMVLYREDTRATSMFFNASGVVKTFRDLPSGRRWVTGFLFPDDVFGLAQNGVYVRTAQTVTEATLYRVQADALVELLRSDPDLEFQFLLKATHELREAQRQTLVVGRRDAVGRVAMFIRQLEQRGMKHHAGGFMPEIEMPMTRSDVASYLGLSAEAVSRATRMLERRGIVSFPGRHRVKILDRVQFDRLVSRL